MAVILPYCFSEHLTFDSVTISTGTTNHIFNHRKWLVDTDRPRRSARFKAVSSGLTITTEDATLDFYAPSCVLSALQLMCEGYTIDPARGVVTAPDGTPVMSVAWQHKVLVADIYPAPTVAEGPLPSPAEDIPAEAPHEDSPLPTSGAVKADTAGSPTPPTHVPTPLPSSGAAEDDISGTVPPSTDRHTTDDEAGNETTLATPATTPIILSPSLTASPHSQAQYLPEQLRTASPAPTNKFHSTVPHAVSWTHNMYGVGTRFYTPLLSTLQRYLSWQVLSRCHPRHLVCLSVEGGTVPEMPSPAEDIPAEAPHEDSPLPTSGAVKADTAGSSTSPTHVPRPLPTSGAVEDDISGTVPPSTDRHTTDDEGGNETTLATPATTPIILSPSPHVPRPLPASGAAEVRTSGAVASPASKTIAGGTAGAADDVFDRFHTTLLSTMQRYLSYSQKMHSWDLVDPPPDSRRRLCRPIFTGGFGFSGRVSLAGF